ncbi:hypothetical protein [Nocardioides sp. TF02-7]|uniref:hypothetical protein n=1 Tax=Nocardioides sp. TF02-7 TaxID=2917724 RepID=UPI001F058CE6|nr:hypothetical protein [Nocardioides sp. TF02-7]UMG93028.1 hypothetical protein MF408_01360 [Nocardioides sp. TF02-7]
MSPRTLAGTLALGVALSGVLSVPVGTASPPPPPDTGRKHTWTEADKTGFGTARTRRSNVWFTLQRGRTSEVFYPDLSTPSVRTLELMVSDRRRSFLDRASRDMRTTVRRPDARSLRFTQVHVDRDGRYRLTETHLTDPARDTYVVRVRLESLDGGRYRLHVAYDPALANGGMDDRARARGRALVAHDERVSSALVARPPLARLRNGLAGRAGRAAGPPAPATSSRPPSCRGSTGSPAAGPPR